MQSIHTTPDQHYMKQLQQQFTPPASGLYATTGTPSGAKDVGPGFDPSFLDTGLVQEDFFSPFFNPDFPIDIGLPLSLGDGVMQAQAPLMQVAQNQSARRNPKLVGKRKLQTAAQARQREQPQQQQPSAPATPAATVSLIQHGLTSQAPCYVDSPPSSQDMDLYADGEPNNKRQKRLVKNRQAAQLFRKRQKQYISDLENKVAEVTNKNIALMAKVDVLMTENQLVKDQLKYLRSFVISALEQAFPPQKYAEMQQQLGDIGLTDSSKKEPTPSTTTTTTAAAAAPASAP